MLGFGPLGSLALGEIPRLPAAVAPGATIDLVVTLEAGRATVERKRRPFIWVPSGRVSQDAVAHGAILNLEVYLTPGLAVGVISPPVVVEHAVAVGEAIDLTIDLVPGGATGDTIEYDNAFLLLVA
jgi:hypothetical protein